MEYRRGEGTSFSAPQVSAAGALLFASDPGLQADQVSTILTRYRSRLGPRHRLPPLLHRPRPAHRLGPARRQRAPCARSTIRCRRPTATRPTIGVVHCRGRYGAARASGSRRRSTTGTTARTSTRSSSDRGQKLVARLRGPAGANSDLFLWKPGTTSVGGTAVDQRFLAAQSRSPGSLDKIKLRVAAGRLVLPRREDRVAAGRASTRSGTGSALGRRSEQLVRSDLADLPRRVADDDRAGGYVADDDRAGSDVGLLSDFDRRAEHRAAADAGASPDRRARAGARAAARCGP